ncbi:MAG TPA: SagB/ThcOx family dehydrogenase [Williamwhitmania sp.]|nr:SagB/ThcOx family dehydrogenase [Williamwhitmania sp.]
MKTKNLALLIILQIFATIGFSQDMDTLKLPTPQTSGGRPLMDILKERKTTRTFSNRELSMQELANLLWAGAGISRPESGKRTAPSANNWQEVEIYVSLKSGVYRYDALQNSLIPVLAEDIRSKTGQQDFVGGAPVNLIYVADYSKMANRPEEMKFFYSGADTGFISENIYLYCASAGLATVVRGMVNREELKTVLKLSPEKNVVFAQTVGYPAE